MKRIYIPDNLQERDVLEKDSFVSLVCAVSLMAVVSVIVLFGLTMLYSTSYEVAGSAFFKKQLVWAGVGLAAGGAIFMFGYRKVADWSIPLLGASVFLLMVADFFCRAVNGAHRWIQIPHVGNLQPSELAKVAVALFLSKYCAENMRHINSFSPFRGFIPSGAACGMVLGLVFLGKDWGTTFLIAAVVGLIFYAAGLRLSILVLPGASIVTAAFCWCKYMDPERWSRLTSFMNPELVRNDDGYQLWNSQLALGSGGWFGLGFMESRLKAKYLPEAHTDFILAIVGEELGYFFLILVITAYIVFVFLGVKISVTSRSKLGMLLGFAVTATVAMQAVINIGVVSGAFPTKGMPAPFISYGGSNLLMCLICVGILVSIALDTASPGLNIELWEDVKSQLRRVNPFARRDNRQRTS
jgi:cell division protein FtsW